MFLTYTFRVFQGGHTLFMVFMMYHEYVINILRAGHLGVPYRGDLVCMHALGDTNIKGLFLLHCVIIRVGRETQ